MTKNQQHQQQPPPISVKETAHKLQLALFSGVKTLDLLYLAGSIISRADYNDVVMERSIADLCGYPLCPKALPSSTSRPHKGRYRISLKEHRVYDLHETYMYCSSRCVIDSKAFAQSLSEERCDVLDVGRVERVLRAFGDLGFCRLEIEEEEGGSEVADLGISKLKIEEKSEVHKGDKGLEGWVGPSNAVEGYVPMKERVSKPLGSKKKKEGTKGRDARTSGVKDMIFNEMDFMSTIITSDEYSVSKMPPSVVGENGFETKFEESKGIVHPNKNGSENKTRQSKGGKGKSVEKDTSETVLNRGTNEARDRFLSEKAERSSEAGLRSSLRPSGSKKLNRSVTWADDTIDSTGSRNLCEVREMEHRMEDSDIFGSMLRLSLEHSAENEVGCSVTWFDEEMDSTKSKDIFEAREVEDAKEGSDVLGSLELQNKGRLESAEACAIAMSQAAEAVASGESDVDCAVSAAGIVILPCPDVMVEEEPTEDIDMIEPEQATQWLGNHVVPLSDLFDPEETVFEPPPEGFSLTLSPFGTMWNSLFTWITSSTLAYVYGRDESFHEEFLFVNETRYPPKIVMDGRSSEVKKTLAESLARALPGVVSELRLATPVSSLEQGLGRMLDTMSFLDALPAFRMKQWKVIVFLFLEGLSVCRIPALTPYMTDRRMLYRKVLDGSQISAEEYEYLKDIIIPLGRAPQFATQSGA